MVTRKVSIDLCAYGLEAIQKAAYRVASLVTIEIGPVDERAAQLTLRFASGATEEDIDRAERAFHRELLDQALRARVAEETKDLRALILAQAFSRMDIFRDD